MTHLVRWASSAQGRDTAEIATVMAPLAIAGATLEGSADDEAHSPM